MITTTPEDFVTVDDVTYPVIYLTERSVTADGTTYWGIVTAGIGAHIYGPEEGGRTIMYLWYPRPEGTRDGIIRDEMKALDEKYIEVALFDGDNLFVHPTEGVRFFVERKRERAQPNPPRRRLLS